MSQQPIPSSQESLQHPCWFCAHTGCAALLQHGPRTAPISRVLPRRKAAAPAPAPVAAPAPAAPAAASTPSPAPTPAAPTPAPAPVSSSAPTNSPAPASTPAGDNNVGNGIFDSLLFRILGSVTAIMAVISIFYSIVFYGASSECRTRGVCRKEAQVERVDTGVAWRLCRLVCVQGIAWS